METINKNNTEFKTLKLELLRYVWHPTRFRTWKHFIQSTNKEVQEDYKRYFRIHIKRQLLYRVLVKNELKKHFLHNKIHYI
jgi:hypothetical protein